MKSLSPEEAHVLFLLCSPNTWRAWRGDEPEWVLIRDTCHATLLARGCVDKTVVQPPTETDMGTARFCINQRGLLALRCHMAAQAQVGS